MRQTEIPLLARIEGPSVVPTRLIDSCSSYREAVRLCWALRRVKGAKPADMAQHTGMVRQHVSDYLNPDDKPGRRDLPGDFVEACEDFCGNTAISQWHAARSKLTVLEEMQAERQAA